MIEALIEVAQMGLGFAAYAAGTVALYAGMRRAGWEGGL